MRISRIRIMLLCADIAPCNRPSTIELEHMRVVLPFVDYMGPKWFRRKLLDIVPYKKLQRMKNIVDIMYERSTEIYRAKKAAIERGDEAAVQQVGEGKDVLSILRVYLPSVDLVLTADHVSQSMRTRWLLWETS